MDEAGMELQKGHELIVSPLESDELISIAEAAERRVKAIKAIKVQALKLTNEEDWENQYGKPYLKVYGATKIARAFGISWKPVNNEYKIYYENDGHFRVEILMEIYDKNTSIVVLGARSSKDDCFETRYQWNEVTKKRMKIKLPPSEIDKNKVIKSAESNAIARGVSRFLGLQNLPWKDLQEVGLDISKISKDGETSSPKAEEKRSSSENQFEREPGEPATEAQITAIGKMLDRLGIKDEFQRHEKVSQILGFESVLPSLSDLTKVQASKVIEALKREGIK